MGKEADALPPSFMAAPVRAPTQISSGHRAVGSQSLRSLGYVFNA